MQKFPCPFCGPRADREFRYGGDAGKQRPARDCTDAEWARYRYQRTNGKGVARELWLHADGCGRWIEIERDTTTHEVFATRSLVP
jgi:heterotetrameric sarcosine oxidase delta subunit